MFFTRSLPDRLLSKVAPPSTMGTSAHLSGRGQKFLKGYNSLRRRANEVEAREVTVCKLRRRVEQP